MIQKKFFVLFVLAAFVLGGGLMYFLARNNFGTFVVTMGPVVASSPAQPSPARNIPSCDGPKSIASDDLYVKHSVTYLDASGTAKTIFDECADSKVSKVYCYENPPLSGNFTGGKVAYDCAYGCGDDGACKKFEATSAFSYPYPVAWSEGKTEFSVTGAALVPTSTTAGEAMYALTFSLKITNRSAVGVAAQLGIRRIANEQGDLAAPSETQFYFSDRDGNGIQPNATESDVPVTFLVPASDKQFEFTTGGASNIFFSVTAQDDGTIKVEKEAIEG